MRDQIDQDFGLPDVINTSVTVRTIKDFQFIDEAIKGDGTQVELTGTRSELKELFSRNELSEYVTNTLPLSFNPKFCHAAEIDKKIQENSDETGFVFRTVPVHLTVGGVRTTLYRPYEFVPGEILEPRYEFVQFPVSGKETKFALVWGCLNKNRKVFSNKQLRGFRIKQKGFTIGDSNTVLPYFDYRATHMNRYIGEIVILSSHIKANTARSDIAYTEHFPRFKTQLKKVAAKYDELLEHTYQESSIALEECGNRIETRLTKFY